MKDLNESEMAAVIPARISDTYMSSDLLTPGQHERITSTSGPAIQPVLQPPYGGFKWGQYLTSGADMTPAYLMNGGGQWKAGDQWYNHRHLLGQRCNSSSRDHTSFSSVVDPYTSHKSILRSIPASGTQRWSNETLRHILYDPTEPGCKANYIYREPYQPRPNYLTRQLNPRFNTNIIDADHNLIGRMKYGNDEVTEGIRDRIHQFHAETDDRNGAWRPHFGLVPVRPIWPLTSYVYHNHFQHKENPSPFSVNDYKANRMTPSLVRDTNPQFLPAVSPGGSGSKSFCPLCTDQSCNACYEWKNFLLSKHKGKPSPYDVYEDMNRYKRDLERHESHGETSACLTAEHISMRDFFDKNREKYTTERSYFPTSCRLEHERKSNDELYKQRPVKKNCPLVSSYLPGMGRTPGQANSGFCDW